MSTNPVQGESWLLTSIWTDVDEAPINPTVELFLQDPSGNMSSPTPTNPAVGTFKYVLLLDEAGIWDGEWVGETVAGIKKCPFTVCVDASVFAGVT